MITKELIHSFIEDKIAKDYVFLVEMKVSSSNQIYIEIDSFDGVSIDYCVEISRLIESQLDRDEEDFELEVSTSSISAPFKVHNHYKKHLGKEIEIFTNENKKLTGVLIEVDENDFVLETETMQKLEGKKKKQLVVDKTTLKYDDVRSTKLVIKFK